MKYVFMFVVGAIVLGIIFVVKTYLIMPYPPEEKRNELQSVVFKERELCNDCLFGAIWVSYFIMLALFAILALISKYIYYIEISTIIITLLLLEGIIIYITYRTIESRRRNDYTITI